MGAKKNPHVDSSNMSSTIVGGVFVILAAVITGVMNLAGSDGSQENGEHRTVTASIHAPPPAIDPPPKSTFVTPIGFADFQAVMKDTTLSREQKRGLLKGFVGQRVRWKGFVDDSNTVVYDPTIDNIYILAMSEDRSVLEQQLFRMPALCWFAVEHQAKLKALARGQSVVVEGTLTEFSAIGSTLKSCRVIQAGD